MYYHTVVDMVQKVMLFFAHWGNSTVRLRVSGQTRQRSGVM